MFIHNNRPMDDHELSSREDGKSARADMPGKTTPGPEAKHAGPSEPSIGTEEEAHVPATDLTETGSGAPGESPFPADGDADDQFSHGRRGLIGLGVVLVIVGVGLLYLRIWWVQIGILYGSSPITQVNVMIGALVVIGIACISFGRNTLTKRGTKNRQAQTRVGQGENAKATEGDAGTGTGWTSWASGTTALVGVGALVVSLLNLIQPINPPSLAVHACPGARVKDVPYVGITADPNGVNSRQGPARSYLPDGRYPGNCSLGFSAYCIGDPIGESGGTKVEAWVTSRWLLMAKQSSKFGIAAANLLSGEKHSPQLISDAFVYPETSYDLLPKGDSKQCPGSYPYPEKVSLQPFNTRTGTFTAVARYATNIGMAVWVPPRQGFINGNSYLQMFSPLLPLSDNPGQTSSSGSKSVKWDYIDMMGGQSQSHANSGNRSLGNVVVLAIPCIAPSVPAQTSTATVSGYRLSSTKLPIKTPDIPQGLDVNHLARAACEADT